MTYSGEIYNGCKFRNFRGLTCFRENKNRENDDVIMLATSAKRSCVEIVHHSLSTLYKAAVEQDQPVAAYPGRVGGEKRAGIDCLRMPDHSKKNLGMFALGNGRFDIFPKDGAVSLCLLNYLPLHESRG